MKRVNKFINMKQSIIIMNIGPDYMSEYDEKN